MATMVVVETEQGVTPSTTDFLCILEHYGGHIASTQQTILKQEQLETESVAFCEGIQARLLTPSRVRSTACFRPSRLLLRPF